jgi:hypothetical protein
VEDGAAEADGQDADVGEVSAEGVFVAVVFADAVDCVGDWGRLAAGRYARRDGSMARTHCM